ncbi:MAG: hypothetical protein SFX72_09265 [Isosphaeraceae bacterium]|nr:hypothetical protein [Isosphaeraceae bacterium]
MTWSYRLRRLGITAFVLVHLSALAVWNVPNCVLRQRFLPIARAYIYPLGLWQNWSMFAPDPMRHTITLEASVIDSKGMVYTHAFPKMADFEFWQRLPRVRHGKFIAYMSDSEFAENRRIAANHALRTLAIPAENYPVELELLYQVKETPPPGTVPDPLRPLVPHSLQTFRYESSEEVSAWQ